MSNLAGVLESLRRLDTCSVANALETFGVRMKNEGYTNAKVRAMFPEQGPVAGFAVTAKVRSSEPPGGGIENRMDWWEHVVQTPGPRIVVFEDVSWEVGRGAIMGSLHVAVMRALGVTGAVTNGSFRDLYELENAGFPLFAGGTSVSHGYVHIIEFGEPVTVGGLKIKPGDILHADRHGVQTIPPEIAEEIPGRVAEMKEREKRLMAFCQGSEFSLEGLRRLMTKEHV